MSEAANNSLLNAATRRVGQIILFFLVAMVLTVVVEWVGMTTLWRDEGVGHSRRLVASEQEALALSVRPGATFGNSVAGFLERAVGEGRYWLIDRTGLTWLTLALSGSTTGISDYLEAAINALETFVLRLAVVVLALPAFLLVGVFAAVEGLTRRALRRYGGGHETAYLFHHGKRLLWPSVFLPSVVYLSAPVALSPVWVYAPALFVFGVGVAVTFSKFKKFL